MSARGIIGGIAGMAATAVKHPRTTTEQALKGAKQMATTGTIVADKLIKKGLGKDGKDSAPARPATSTAPAPESAATAAATAAESVEKAAGKVERTAEKVADKAADEAGRAAKEESSEKAPAKKATTKKSTAKKAPTKKSTAKKAPAKKSAAKKPAKQDDHDVVLSVDNPTPPEEPPVDVVGETLAKEAEEEKNGPTGSTLPPVREKDEAEADPATLKAVRAEAEMMTKAASPRKG